MGNDNIEARFIQEESFTEGYRCEHSEISADQSSCRAQAQNKGLSNYKNRYYKGVKPPQISKCILIEKTTSRNIFKLKFHILMS